MAAAISGATVPVHPRADAILKYWCGEDYAEQDASSFNSTLPPLWYGGMLDGPSPDQEIKDKFASDVEAVAAGKYDNWTSSFDGLAALILMDQFTRNIYRNSREAYSLDPKAIKLAYSMMASGEDKKLVPLQRHWVYTPFQHSEALADQKESVRLHQGLFKENQNLAGDGPATKFLGTAAQFCIGHCKTVEENGRFPHRDAILGRS
ncbi:hypothetical protein WJX84_011528 [Apatococcus fuscideae]|uniref:DUF924-domain-containing protein n=1 Tax=Apatococcus fuscideae TaxID=2026836 RepID=A0AAW1RXD5_9CHLO